MKMYQKPLLEVLELIADEALANVPISQGDMYVTDDDTDEEMQAN